MEKEIDKSIDTTNLFAVGTTGDRVVVLRNIMPMTKYEALNLAAYLVALSGASREEWEATLNAVENV